MDKDKLDKKAALEDKFKNLEEKINRERPIEEQKLKNIKDAYLKL